MGSKAKSEVLVLEFHCTFEQVEEESQLENVQELLDRHYNQEMQESQRIEPWKRISLLEPFYARVEIAQFHPNRSKWPNKYPDENYSHRPMHN